MCIDRRRFVQMASGFAAASLASRWLPSFAYSGQKEQLTTADYRSTRRFAAMATGLVSSLGTDWGLFRYYWIVVKLLVTVPTIVLMLVHMRPVNRLASLVSIILLPNADLARPGLQLLLYACAAQLVLLVATVLSTYKPRGRTRHAARA